jgi:hypothetical protein
MRPAVQLADTLEPVYARNSRDAHLSLFDWDTNAGDAHTLCGQPVLVRARSVSFLAAGCLLCAERADSAGISLVRDGNSVVSLRRFIHQRRSHAH